MIQSEDVLAARRQKFGSVDNTVSEDVLAARRLKFGNGTVNEDVLAARRLKFGNGTVNEDVRMKRQQKFGVVERTNTSSYTRQNRKRNGGFVTNKKMHLVALLIP